MGQVITCAEFQLAALETSQAVQHMVDTFVTRLDAVLAWNLPEVDAMTEINAALPANGTEVSVHTIAGELFC